MSLLPEQPRTPLPPGTTQVVVDGTPRHALNSEDQPLHWSEEGVRNFWRWFGNSSVIDGQGRPLVVRHGSASADIDVFDPGKAGSVQPSDWGRGVYFTPSRTVAAYYAEEACSRAQDPRGDELYRQYEETTRRLGTRPMFEWMDFGSRQDPESQAKYREIKEALQVWQDHKEAFRKANAGTVYEVYLKIEAPLDYVYAGITEPDMHMLAAADRRDGIIIRHEPDDDETHHESIEEIVVFSATHIKCAAANSGLFDSSAPAIRDAPAPVAAPRQPGPVDAGKLQQLDSALNNQPAASTGLAMGA